MLTAAQIVADALQAAKCPGFTAQGGRALNLVLDDLAQHRNLKVNLVTSTIALAANSNGPFPVEANYLRTYDLFYLIDGDPYFLEPCSLRQYDAEPQQSGLSNYPYEFATDLSAVATGGVGQMYVYPKTPTPYTLTHRYYLKQPQITTPETSSTVPWFEDQDYLMVATALRMMRITDDARYDKWEADAEVMLRKHLLTEGDEQQVVKEVKLDPRRFHVGGRIKPTKLDPW